MNEREAKLRSEKNYALVNEFFATAEKKTADMLQGTDCPCLTKLIIERCTDEELKTLIKFLSIFAQLEEHIMVNFCPEHTAQFMFDLAKASFAFCLSTVDHATQESTKREILFPEEIELIG